MITFLRRWLIGHPLATAQASHERLSKKVALAVFSSDALSSTSYATEEILLVLAVAKDSLMISILQNRATGYLSAVLGIAAVTAILAPFHDQPNNTTVALALLLVVLFVATGWESWPAFLASLLGVLYFNFFFLPPVYTFTIADPQNWIALTAFFTAAITAEQLSVRMKQRAAEAEAGRKEAWLASAYNRSLIEASLDPLVTVGRDGKITDLNVARIGKFSSDRTVEGYARAIWDIKSVEFTS
jgi:K+-sensing histidine kinase KdpD